MEQPEASYSSSMRKCVFAMTSSRAGAGFDRKVYPPFQAIIDKGKQAKAQVENDQYEARKAKKETDIKNAARIRQAEAEANRRRAEESNLSIDDHKGRLLDELTKNIKAVLENQYREEIREKVYEDEDRIVSAYEHDIKDQTKARLVRELESVVKAKLGAEFEPEVKQQLAVELESIVKAELRAKYEKEVKQQLAKELGPEVEAQLRAKYETQVKQHLAKELQSGVKAELRAKYEEEIKNQLMIELEPTIVHVLKGTRTNDAENEPKAQGEVLHTPNGESFRATPNDVAKEGGEYPDLSYHQHLIDQNGVQSGWQEAGSVRNRETSNTDEDAVDMPRGMKRPLSGEDDKEEDPYAHHSKRSRSASFNSEEQQLPSAYEEGDSNIYSSSPHGQQLYQDVRYNREESQGFLQYKGDAGYEDPQGLNGHKMDGGEVDHNRAEDVPGVERRCLDRKGADYDSAEDAQATHGNLSDREEADYDSAEDVQGVNGSFLDREEADYDSAEDIQGINGNLSDREEADCDSAEDAQGTNGNLSDREEADYDSTEHLQESSGYNLDGEATESYTSEEDDEGEDGEEYESEREEQFSTAPQAAPHSNAGNGVITFSNTQDTAFILSDSEDDEDRADDEDKTLVGYAGPTTLNDAKHYNVSIEESLFPHA
ncbi:MAG: hypothetical protein ASARMPRED_002356 [Alectoria sarmentosa]|nr:MAG: hypothetical protein ASARMPRED_002356 [Alectoria sarmentosa]